MNKNETITVADRAYFDSIEVDILVDKLHALPDSCTVPEGLRWAASVVLLVGHEDKAC